MHSIIAWRIFMRALGIGASVFTLMAVESAAAQTMLPTVTVEAPKVRARKAVRPSATPSASAQTARRAVRGPARTRPVRVAGPARARPAGPSGGPSAGASSTAETPSFTPSVLRSPPGQTVTTVPSEIIRNTPVFTVGDLLQYSPGVSTKVGNGPRDIGISIRGSNARNGFGVRNIVVLEDGFPVTQPDGLSRTDLIDPHAYGAVDVFRGPSSALFGNYATGGAVNFRMRTGAEIDGAEIGTDFGSYGYLNSYLIAGKASGAFDLSLFASDVRGDGYISHSQFNTQTINFVGR